MRWDGAEFSARKFGCGLIQDVRRNRSDRSWQSKGRTILRANVRAIILPPGKSAAILLGCFAFAAMASGVRAADAVGASVETSGASATQGPNDTGYHNKQDELQEVVVTGSLIPTTERETFTPVLTITTQDITAKGFADIAEALQRTSYATGSVQNGQEVNGFTQGAKTVSFFG